MMDITQIDQVLKTADDHLRKLEGMSGLLREIIASLNELRHARERDYLFELQQLKITVSDITSQLEKRGLPHSDKYEKELQELRRAIESPEWPLAVEPVMICNSEEKTLQRADSILDLLVGEHMKNKRFLDYGCGQGHTIIKARERETKIAVGYDVDISKATHSMGEFTDKFDEVKKKGPYDIVLLHDVLDHAVLMDPIQILQQVKSVLSPKGRVYVRNHPWSGRHGGHLYEQKNKAFLHLVFDSVELTRVGNYHCEPNIRILTPFEVYRHWFAESGFKVNTEIPIKNSVEDYFLRPSLINSRIKKHFENPDAMVNQLELTFVEYTLEAIGLDQQIF